MKPKIGNVYKDITNEDLDYVWRNYDIYWIATSRKTVLIEFTMFNFEKTDLENKTWLWGLHTNPRGFRHLVFESMYTKNLNME